MANEITAACSLNVNKVAQITSGALSKTADMSGDQMLTNVQIIGTVNEAILLGDVATVGYVLFKNMDATNFIQLALHASTLQVFAKLLPGDVTLIKAGTATMYAKADTGACNL